MNARRSSIFVVVLTGVALLGQDAHAQLDPGSLFRAATIRGVSGSPNGRWVSAIARKGHKSFVVAQQVGVHVIESVYGTNNLIREMEWIGADTLLLLIEAPTMRVVVTLDLRQVGTMIVSKRKMFKASGWLVDPLPLVDGEVLWEFENKGDDSVHKLSIDDLERLSLGQQRGVDLALDESVVAVVNGTASRWIVDRQDRVRAALQHEGDEYVLLVREDSGSGWRESYRFKKEDPGHSIWPLAIARDGMNLVVSSYHGRDTLGLYEYDINENEISREILVLEGRDITRVKFDFVTRELIAAYYLDEGVDRAHYFDEYADKNLLGVDQRFPHDRVFLLSTSRDRATSVLWVSGPAEPGAYYFHDRKKGELTLVAEVFEYLDRKALVDVEAFHVLSRDGLEVEAYLALPKIVPESGAPLVVVPHGGPIGVRDSRSFNPFVQYLASAGLAVLQVNYRGSSGYGRRFEEAGKRQWSKGIEDDIDAAVEAVSVRPEIDSARMCIAGGSYGGFSALTSVVRHPARYRCAVSINGVTDISLMAETSDFSESESSLALFAENAGDVTKERAEMMRASPLYHAEQIEVPLLVIYGSRDRRVDPDHAHRLMLILELLRKDFEEIEVAGAAHSFTYRQERDVYPKLLKFLMAHLVEEDALSGGDRVGFRAENGRSDSIVDDPSQAAR